MIKFLSVALLCSSLLANAQLPTYVPSNGLVAWWGLNGNLNDDSGNNNTGSNNGATPTTDRYGNANGAYSFDGSASYISAPTSPSLESPTTKLTMSAWINLSGYSLVGQAFGPILTKSNSSANAFMYRFTVDINGTSFYAGINNWTSNTGAAFNFSLNQWYMLTAVLDSFTSYFYLNDSLIATNTFTTNITTDALPLEIGRDVPGSTEVFNGKIDDIGIWNVALTPQQISNLYLSSAPLPPYVPTNGLAAWYSFNGNANDESGNGHHGTIHGAVLCPDRFNQPMSAYYFSGNNQQIICSNDTSITNQHDVSVSAWFNVENRAGGWQQNVILANIGVYNNSGGFEILTSNPPNADITGMFRTTTYADQNLGTMGFVNIDSAQWNHMVYMFHYITSEDSTQATIYLNGNFVKSQKFFHSVTYTGITSLIIGTNIDSAGYQRSFKGKIDDVGLWNRVLTQQEITNLFNSTNVGESKLSPQLHLNVFPNPAAGDVTVNLSGNAKEITGLILYDAKGTVIKNISATFISNNSGIKFSLADLPRGIYLLRIISGKNQWIEKIIKQ